MKTARLAFLALAAALLPACLEAEAALDLRKDGTGTFAWKSKASPKTAEALRTFLKECREATAEGESFVVPEALTDPSEADRREAAAAGLTLDEWESGLAKEVFEGRGRVTFARISSLDATVKLRSGAKAYRLRRGDDGVYELTLGADDPKEAAKRVKPMVELMSDKRYSGPFSRASTAVSRETEEMRMTFSFKVPGEILECRCAGEVERKGPGEVRVDASTKAILREVERRKASGATPDWKPGDPTFLIRFRMPEGESIPADKVDAPEPPPKKPDAGPQAPAPGSGANRESGRSPEAPPEAPR